MPVQSGHVSPPRPSYFISRSNGWLVPLIPADELPSTVRLQGVSRVLQFEQTYGMQHVGSAPYTRLTFKLDGNSTPLEYSASQQPVPSNALMPAHNRNQSGSSSPTRRYLAPDALARQALAQQSAKIDPTNTASATLPWRPLPVHDAANSWRSKAPTPIDNAQSVIDAIISSNAGAAEAARVGYVPKPTITPPSGALPDQEKKEYCTYWIRHGECDYMQQGCWYKHEMPDKATLQKIGLRSVPRWWLEKQRAAEFGGGSGEGRARVGMLVKSSVWINRSKELSGSDGDDESVCSESEGSSHAASNQEVAEQPVVILKKTKLPENDRPEAASESKGTTTAIENSDRQAAKKDDRQTLWSSRSAIRKDSATSDLIDFAPLISSPSSYTPDLTVQSPVDPSPKVEKNKLPAQFTGNSKCAEKSNADGQTTTSTSVAKVFVPKGESVIHHRAEAHKRERVARRHGEAKSMQKAKAANGGLMASKHATPSADNSTQKRGGRAGSRPRRLVRSSGASVGAKKDGAGKE